MAEGLAATVERFAAVVEGCDTSTDWKRSQQKLSTLTGDPSPKGIDYKYWVAGRMRGMRPIVAGNKVTSKCRIEVELAVYFGGGDKRGKEHYSLHKTLEGLADRVEQSLGHPNNWDVSNTGLILCNMIEGKLQEQDRVMLWIAAFDVMIRHDQVATVVT